MLQNTPPLTEQANSLLAEILSMTRSAGLSNGIDVNAYRARHEDNRKVLDALKQEGFIAQENNKYRVTLKGLSVLKNEQANAILSVCKALYAKFRKEYKKNPNNPIFVSKLSGTKTKTIEALTFLRDAPMWGGVSADLMALDAIVQPSEGILDYATFDGSLGQIWEWHKSNYPYFNELIFNETTKSTDRIDNLGKSSVRLERVAILPSGLSDAPIDKENDALGYRVYADAIVDFLTNKNTHAPFSLAITGPWGSGKTTLLRWIQKSLEEHPNRYSTVWFTPWKYSEQEEVWSAFAREISDTLMTPFWRTLRLWWSRFTDAMPSGWWFLITTVLGLCIGLIVILLEGSIHQSIHIASLVAMSPLVGAALRSFQIPALRFLATVKGPDYEQKLGFQREFERDLNRLIRIAADRGKPIFIFVDDLDRAPPPIPVKLLEAMNILVGQKQCIFIVGLDLDMVAASIETKYLSVIQRMEQSTSGAKKFSGKDFIEKLMQLEFALPALSANHLDEFLDSILGAPATTKRRVQKNVVSGSAETLEGHSTEIVTDAQTTDQLFPKFEETVEFVHAVYELSHALPRNPRKIKRFINTFRLLAYIAARRGLFLNGVVSINGLGAITVLALEYPEIYSLLSRGGFQEKLKNVTVWLNDLSGRIVSDEHVLEYGLIDNRERYLPLLAVLHTAIDIADRINDYLSLSEVIDMNKVES